MSAGYYHGLSSSSDGDSDSSDHEDVPMSTPVAPEPISEEQSGWSFHPWPYEEAKEGQRVKALVARIMHREVVVDIIEIAEGISLPLKARPQGIIKYSDVRGFDREQLQLPRCFKTGDVISATVKGVETGGTRRIHLLSTTEPEDGVITAISVDHGMLEPVSWCLMRCKKTGKFEPRKVAKPFKAAPTEPTSST